MNLTKRDLKVSDASAGMNRIRAELRNKGIDDDIINQAMMHHAMMGIFGVQWSKPLTAIVSRCYGYAAELLALHELDRLKSSGLSEAELEKGRNDYFDSLIGIDPSIDIIPSAARAVTEKHGPFPPPRRHFIAV